MGRLVSFLKKYHDNVIGIVFLLLALLFFLKGFGNKGLYELSIYSLVSATSVS